MKTLPIICCIWLLASCHNAPIPAEHVSTDIRDTTYLKTIKWDSLNTYVEYHIIQRGYDTDDINIHFAFEDLGHYEYLTHTWKATLPKLNLLSNDSIVLTSAELRKFLRCDSFSKRKDFDCLLKVNSELFYQIRPGLLTSISVRPKNTDDKSINALIAELKKEKYTRQVTAEMLPPNHFDYLLNSKEKTLYIRVGLKPEYQDLSQIKNVCAALNKRKSIANAVFYEFYTGLNKADIVYRLSTLPSVASRKLPSVGVVTNRSG